MSIRKRTWTSRKGKQEAWIVDYTDQHGKRRHKTFAKKKDADNYAASTHVQVREGTHVADSQSITVLEAGRLWLRSAEAEGVEKTTWEQYEQHLRLHIAPFLGPIRLSQLSALHVTEFRDRLRAGDPELTPAELHKLRKDMRSDGRRRKNGGQRGNEKLTDDALRRLPRSPAMVRGIISSLGALLANALEQQLVGRNVVRELRKRRKRGTARDDRHKTKLKTGVDIPTPDEIRRLIAQAKGRWRPFLITAIGTGLRASELRGLLWTDLDLTDGKSELHVRQRADRFNQMGPPKSGAGQRTIPLTPTVVSELREWKLKCPKKNGKLGLVFPNGKGNVESHNNIVRRGLIPAILAAGIANPALDERGVAKRDEGGKPIVEPKYTGLHVLRHFFASWCIERLENGGRALPPKHVQTLLGHSTITMTLDTYGHLFPRGDDADELKAADKRLFG